MIRKVILKRARDLSILLFSKTTIVILEFFLVFLETTSTATMEQLFGTLGLERRQSDSHSVL